MPSVFISYRHESDSHRTRVRALARRLEAAGLAVTLDQAFLEANPGGPDEGWPTWSIRQAERAERILIVASDGWFRCFDGLELPGAGLGSSAEGRIIRQRLYNASGVSAFARIIALDEVDPPTVPTELQGYHRFVLDRDFEALAAWITGQAQAASAAGPEAEWPIDAEAFEWEAADCLDVRRAFLRMLEPRAAHRVMRVRGASETGKSHLTRHLRDLTVKHTPLACGRLDLKNGGDLEREVALFAAQLGLDDLVESAQPSMRVRLDAVVAHLGRKGRPAVLIFDTFEQSGVWGQWIEDRVLLAAARAPWLRVVVAGQTVPNSAGTAWSELAMPVLELQRLGWEDWHRFGLRHSSQLSEQFTRELYDRVGGQHTLLATVLGQRR